jgi:hypothetical protein
MDHLSYDAAPVAVRDAFAAAHGRFWQRLAAPAAWWRGAERVAIAAEVRNAPQCRLCQERKAAISPNAMQGEHDHLGDLPEAVVDVIHRVLTDPGRLSKAWFEGRLAAGLSEEQYVEIIGTLVALVNIDSFCRGIGVPVHPLPQPVVGEPTQYRPSPTISGQAWVSWLAADHDSGAEAGLFPTRPVANVIRAMSLVPDEVRTLLDLSAAHYLETAQVRNPNAARGPLSRAQMELVAGRVSALRKCFY